MYQLSLEELAVLKTLFRARSADSSRRLHVKGLHPETVAVTIRSLADKGLVSEVASARDVPSARLTRAGLEWLAVYGWSDPAD